MAIADTPPRIMEELADLLASSPSPDQLLSFRPSEAVQQRARELLAKQNDGSVDRQEQHELDQFAQAELLVRLIKARVKQNGSR